MSGWSCPHEIQGDCKKLNRDCDPGIVGCVLRGQVFFPNRPDKNPSPEELARLRARREKKRAQDPSA